jgi:putative ABC transport system ATP-binding protein
MIELKNVTKVYKMGKIEVTALKDINLQVTEGEFLALAGPSGSGKTTFLNILGCLDTPTQGEIVIGNQEIVKMPAKQKTIFRRDKIGFIFQNFNLVPIFNVYENVEYPLLLTGIKPGERKTLVQKVLEEVGLAPRARHFPQDLSGGERQRVSIARALVKRPVIILADEPTANLDSAIGQHIVELLQKLHHEEKVTIIFSSHDSLILSKVERIIKIRDGRLTA